jgi:hypothetical protein
MVQVVKHLPNKHEAPSSNPNTAPHKNKEKKKPVICRGWGYNYKIKEQKKIISHKNLCPTSFHTSEKRLVYHHVI